MPASRSSALHQHRRVRFGRHCMVLRHRRAHHCGDAGRRHGPSGRHHPWRRSPCLSLGLGQTPRLHQAPKSRHAPEWHLARAGSFPNTREQPGQHSRDRTRSPRPRTMAYCQPNSPDSRRSYPRCARSGCNARRTWWTTPSSRSTIPPTLCPTIDQCCSRGPADSTPTCYMTGEARSHTNNLADKWTLRHYPLTGRCRREGHPPLPVGAASAMRALW